MPTGLFDIADRAEVLQPEEIQRAYYAEMQLKGGRSSGVLENWKIIVLTRWNRCVATANLIDWIRAQR
jgi:hypothetical protein